MRFLLSTIIIFLINVLYSQDFVFPVKYRIPKTIHFGRTIIEKKETNWPVDTSQEIYVRNYLFNIELRLERAKLNSLEYQKQIFSEDSFACRLINRSKLLYEVIVKDPQNKIVEQGFLKGIGPVHITIEYDSGSVKDYKFFYRYDYYLIKVGKWSVLNRKSNQYETTNYELPEIIDEEKLWKEDRKQMYKRREKYIKKHHLPKDYAE